MKKLIHIFILTMLLGVAMLLGLAGCGPAGLAGAGTAPGEATASATQADAGQPEAAATSLPHMEKVYITAAAAPGDEYQDAQVIIRDSAAPIVASGNAAGTGPASEERVGAAPAQSAEIKLRGNSTREVDKKAYTIKFEEEQEFLGMEPGRKWALVSDPFDKSLLRPAVGLTFAKALEIEYTPDFRLCQVWVNDIYMGVYTAMEPIEAGNGRVGIDVDGGDFLLERNMGRTEDDVTYMDSSLGMRFEFNEPEEPDAAQMEECRKMLMAAEEAICSGDHNYYEQYIDVDSFVNFYIFHEVIKDIDFGEYSTRYYFEDGILHAGPPWDLDLTMGNVSTEKDEFKYASYNNVDGAGDESGDSTRGLWAVHGDYYYWLSRDPWFMEKVQQRWYAVRHIAENLAEENEMGGSVIDRYLKVYEEELAGNFRHVENKSVGTGVPGGTGATDASWSVSEPAHMSEWQQPAGDYAGNVEMLRSWLMKRVAYMDSQLGPFVYTPALAVQ